MSSKEVYFPKYHGFGDIGSVDREPRSNLANLARPPTIPSLSGYSRASHTGSRTSHTQGGGVEGGRREGHSAPPRVALPHSSQTAHHSAGGNTAQAFVVMNLAVEQPSGACSATGIHTQNIANFEVQKFARRAAVMPPSGTPHRRNSIFCSSPLSLSLIPGCS